MKKVILGLAALLAAMAGTANAADARNFNIPPGDLAPALESLAKATGLELIFQPAELKGLRTQGVTGTLSPQEAVAKLIDGTKLVIRTDAAGAILISSARPPVKTTDALATAVDVRLAQSEDQGMKKVDGSSAPTPPPAAAASDRNAEVSAETSASASSGTPEIMVKGSRLLNMDIRRTRDDIQPYVVFEREMLEASGAPNLDNFLKQRLTMNTIHISNSQITDGPSSLGAGNMSSINLRGLGGNQTLILIDGRRTARTMDSSGDGTAPWQADLNSIPLSAIERVEILPTTASGTYGGSATGGVINVILRRDYTGTEVQLTQDDSVRSDAPLRRIEFSFGTNFEGGKTSLMLRGGYMDRDMMLQRERDLTPRGRALILKNNPGFFSPGAVPPLGYTTNIQSEDGSNLQLKPAFGGTVLTSPFTYIPVGFPGATPANAGQLVANAGHYNLDFADSAQWSGGGNYAMLTAATVQSFTGTLRREFGSNVQAFIDFSAGRNASRSPVNGMYTSGLYIPDTAPNNPFVQSIYVTAPNNDNSMQRVRNDTRRASAGVIVKLPRRWSASADYTWNEGVYNISGLLGDFPDPGIADGSLDVLRDTNLYPVDYSDYHGIFDTSDNTSRTETASLRLSGPLGSLPGGAPIVSALLEHRQDAFGLSGRTFYTLYGTYLASKQTQAVDSAYLEVNLPLISEINKRRGLRELELQFAVRTDRYSTVTRSASIEEGSTEPSPVSHSKLDSSNPTVGLRYRPFDSLMLRASYSTGFQPPTVDQLAPPNQPFPASAGLFVDPKRGNELNSRLQIYGGGNPHLRPEKSKSWSAGAVLTPRLIPGLRVSLDYTNIEKRDNIYSRFGTVPGYQLLTNNEDLLPGRVIRGPVPSGDPFGVGPIIALNTTFINLSRAEVQAFDAAADYHLEIGTRGALDFYALSTWQPHFRTQILPTSPIVDTASVATNNPLKLKDNAGVTWTRSRWTMGWSMNYFGSYQVGDPAIPSTATTVLNQGSVKVPSQYYHDVFARYVFASVPRFLSSVQVQAGIRNIFDTAPPFDAGVDFLGYYSPFGDPRLASYYFTLKTAF